MQYIVKNLEFSLFNKINKNNKCFKLLNYKILFLSKLFFSKMEPLLNFSSFAQAYWCHQCKKEFLIKKTNQQDIEIFCKIFFYFNNIVNRML